VSGSGRRPVIGTILCGVAAVIFASLAALAFTGGDAGTGVLYLVLTALWVGMAAVLQRRRSRRSGRGGRGR